MTAADRLRADIANRLNEVRGARSTMDFWRSLGYADMRRDDPERISYESAARYHRGERMPADSYFHRVAEQERVRVEWLRTGRGEKFVAAEEIEEEIRTHAAPFRTDSEIVRTLTARFPRFRIAPYAVKAAFLGALKHWIKSFEDDPATIEANLPGWAEHLWSALEIPADTLALPFWSRDVVDRQGELYYLGVLTGLTALIPGPGQGTSPFGPGLASSDEAIFRWLESAQDRATEEGRIEHQPMRAEVVRTMVVERGLSHEQAEALYDALRSAMDDHEERMRRLDAQLQAQIKAAWLEEAETRRSLADEFREFGELGDRLADKFIESLREKVTTELPKNLGRFFNEALVERAQAERAERASRTRERVRRLLNDEPP